MTFDDLTPSEQALAMRLTDHDCPYGCCSIWYKGTPQGRHDVDCPFHAAERRVWDWIDQRADDVWPIDERSL